MIGNIIYLNLSNIVGALKMQIETINVIKVILKEYQLEYTERQTAKSFIFEGKTNQNRKQILASVDFSLRQFGISSQHILRSSKSSSSGHIETDDGVYVVLKPTNGATENLKINGSKLTQHGTNELLLNIFSLEEPVKCKSFNSAKEIENSVLKHFDDNPNVGLPIIRTFEKYFNSSDTSVIDWNPLVSQSEKNELAKHLGEPLLGYIAFKSKDWERVTQTSFLNLPIKSFKVPNESNYSEIDSIFVDSSDHIHFISNKVSRGARASFFTNILPIISKVNPNNLNADLREFVTISKSIINPERNGKQIVYRYGINYILGLNLSNPYKVFYDIVSKKDTPEVKTVIKGVKKFLNANPRPYRETVLSKLNEEDGYSSLTVFLCQEITRLFNQKETNDILIKMISGKKIYQASLNTGMWNKGSILYSINETSTLSLKIVGDKSSYGDINAGHGLINFALL